MSTVNATDDSLNQTSEIIKNNYSNEKIDVNNSVLGTSQKQKSQVNIKKQSADLGKEKTIEASVTDENGNPITSGRSAFKLNGKTMGYANVSGGVVKFNKVLDPDNFGGYDYKLEVVYGGNNKYDSSRANTVLTINSFTPVMNYSAKVFNSSHTDLTLKISNSTKGSIHYAKSGNAGFKINGVTYKLNGKPYIVKVKNGTALFKVETSMLEKAKNVTFTYSGNSQFKSHRKTVKNISIIKDTPIITLKSSVLTSNNCKLTFKLVNDTKNNIRKVTSGNIGLKINGVTYKVNGKVQTVHVKNGEAVFNMNTSNMDGKYNLTVTYSGNDIFYSGRTTFKDFSIINPNSVLTINQTNTTDKLSAKISVSVKRLNGSSVGSNGNISVYLNNKYMSSNKVTGGIAKVTLPKLSFGRYNLTLVHSSDVYKANKTFKFIVKTDPLLNKIKLTSSGKPDVELMQNYKWANENGSYTLTREQYNEVIQRDSREIYLNKYMSKYVAFRTKDEPKIYHVLRREKWNVIERQLNIYLVTNTANVGPKELTVNLKGKEYTYSEVRDIQNKSYTCAPAALSVCSQALRNYVSESTWSKESSTETDRGTYLYKLVKAVTKFNMSATSFYQNNYISSIKKLSEGGCVVIFHTTNHYLAIIDINKDKTKVLVVNSYGDYNVGGDTKLPTKWISISTLQKNYNNDAACGAIIKLNYSLSSSEKSKLANYYSNMGGKFTRANTSERIINTASTSYGW